MKKFFFAITLLLPIILFSNTNSYSQSKNVIDSLKSALIKADVDSIKAKILVSLAKNYYYEDADSFLFYVDTALSFSEKIGRHNNVYILKAYKGYFYRERGQYDKALENFEASYQAAIKMNDSASMASSLGNIGNIYFEKGEYKKALLNFKKTLDIFEKLNNLYGLGTVHGVLGNLYLAMNNEDEAIKQYEKSKKYFKKIYDGNQSPNVLNSIATNDMNLGIIYKRKKNYDKALDYYKKALDIYNQIGNNYGSAQIYANMAEVYSMQNDKKMSIKYKKKSLELFRKGQYLKDVVLSEVSLAESYKSLGNYEESLKYAQKAMQDIKNLSSKNILPDIYYLFYDNYKRMNKSAKALEYYEKYVQTKDSIRDKLDNDKMQELMTKFETERKEKEIQILNKEKELQAKKLELKNTLLLVAVIILVIIIIYSFFLLKLIKIKKEQNNRLEAQNVEISQQNEEIRAQRDEIEHHKNLLDKQNMALKQSITYASRIQRAILPEENVLNKYFSENFILYKPKNIVSGDFYWVKEIDNKIIVVAADCTGHGVPGAFMSVLGVTLLEVITNSYEIDNAASVLYYLRKAVMKALKQSDLKTKNYKTQDGMDLALCIFDADKKHLQFAGANRPLIIIRNNEIIKIKGDKFPVGLSLKKDNEYTNNEIEIHKGDSIYIFSDGFSDQFGSAKNTKFFAKRFFNKLLEINTKPMSEQAQILEDTHKKWKGKRDQTDDILVIGIKI